MEATPGGKLGMFTLLAVVAETFPDKALVVFVLASPSTAAAGLLNDGSYLSY
jgi:hypothetical protein